jgi:hypothetical protein
MPVQKSTEVIVPNEVLINKIFYIRKQKVMLDRDLAVLYGVNPRRLREQVKRNAAKFPENFMFILNSREAGHMVSQNAIPSKRHLGGSLPMAFTEHGVLMLSNILKSRKAVRVSIHIIEVFIKLREMLHDNTEIRLAIEKLENKTDKNTRNIEVVFRYFEEVLRMKQDVKKRRRIGYKIPRKKS